MKKLFITTIVLSILFCLVLGLNANAATIVESGSCGTNVTYTLDSDGVLTISGSGEMYDYESVSSPWVDSTDVTSVVIEDGVTGIGAQAFTGCKMLTYVTMPDSIISIGNSSFYNCSGLKSVTVPVGVESIGNAAFKNCSGLTTVYWNGKNVKDCSQSYYNDISIFYNAGTDSGFSVIFGDTVEYIPGYAFYKCNGLKSVTVSENVTSIGRHTFYLCLNLTEVYWNGKNVAQTTDFSPFDEAGLTSGMSVVFGESVKSIPDRLLFKCAGLKSVTISENVTDIGDYAFSGCSSLTDVYWNAKNAACPGYYIFSDSGSDEGMNVIFGATVEVIPKYAFSGCTNLLGIVIPDTVKCVYPNSFSDASLYYTNDDNWTNGVLYAGNWILSAQSDINGVLNIKDGCVGIVDGAFSSCTSIRAVQVKTIEDWLKIKLMSSSASPLYRGAILYIDGQKIGESIAIPAGVEEIGQYAFDNIADIKTTVIPESVKCIGKNAFGDAKSITGVYVPSLGAWCDIEFEEGNANPLSGGGATLYVNGEATTELIISEDITAIKDYAFYNYDNLTYLSVPNSVKSLGCSAFYGCDGLVSATISGGVSTIGDYAFYNCKELSFISMRYGIKSIGNGAFYDCDSIAAITIPSSMSSIGAEAFYDCDALKAIDITDSVLSVGEKAFYSCDELYYAIISNNVEIIEEGTFGYCGALTEVTIGNKISSIKTDAFAYCNELGSVQYNGAEIEWMSVNVSSGNQKLLDAMVDYVKFIDVTGIGLSKSTASIKAGEKLVLTATITPDDATSRIVMWESSDESVATVSNGIVTGVNLGAATITARTPDGSIKAECTVSVTVPVTGITLDKTEVTLNENTSTTLIADVIPENATNPNIVWSSSNTEIAAVDQSGKVRALKAGTAIVKVTTEDGGYEATCTVTVNPVIDIKTTSVAAGGTKANITFAITWGDVECGTLFVGVYDDNGILTGMGCVDLTNATTSIKVPVYYLAKPKTYKAFMWNNPTDMEPVLDMCEGSF